MNTEVKKATHLLVFTQRSRKQLHKTFNMVTMASKNTYKGIGWGIKQISTALGVQCLPMRPSLLVLPETSIVKVPSSDGSRE